MATPKARKDKRRHAASRTRRFRWPSRSKRPEHGWRAFGPWRRPCGCRLPRARLAPRCAARTRPALGAEARLHRRGIPGGARRARHFSRRPDRAELLRHRQQPAARCARPSGGPPARHGHRRAGRGARRARSDGRTRRGGDSLELVPARVAAGRSIGGLPATLRRRARSRLARRDLSRRSFTRDRASAHSRERSECGRRSFRQPRSRARRRVRRFPARAGRRARRRYMGQALRVVSAGRRRLPTLRRRAARRGRTAAARLGERLAVRVA